MRRTADSIETTKAQKPTENTGENKETPKKRGRVENLKPWKPGQSGNPGGRPKNDLAKEIAQAVFEQNGPAIYQAMGAALLKGNAYAFDVIACRAFGKLKEKVEHSVDEALLQRLAEGRKRASNHNT